MDSISSQNSLGSILNNPSLDDVNAPKENDGIGQNFSQKAMSANDKDMVNVGGKLETFSSHSNEVAKEASNYTFGGFLKAIVSLNLLSWMAQGDSIFAAKESLTNVPKSDVPTLVSDDLGNHGLANDQSRYKEELYYEPPKSTIADNSAMNSKILNLSGGNQRNVEPENVDFSQKTRDRVNTNDAIYIATEYERLDAEQNAKASGLQQGIDDANKKPDFNNELTRTATNNTNLETDIFDDMKKEIEERNKNQ